jgi:hypothetical protein
MSKAMACADSETDATRIISWESCRSVEELRLYYKQRLGPESDLPEQLTVISREEFLSKLLRSGTEDGIFARVYNCYPEMLDDMVMLYNRTQVAISFNIETAEVGQAFLEYLQEHGSEMDGSFLRDLTRSIQWCRAMHHKWRQRAAASGIEYIRVAGAPSSSAWEDGDE